MMEIINIQLSDLKWQYSFVPRGQGICYHIEDRKELVAIKTYKGFSYEIYRQSLDTVDLVFWNKEALAK